MRPTRTPAVSGTFYPSLPARLRADVRTYLGEPTAPPRRAAAVIAPHAGYVYSGPVAGLAFGSVEVPSTCVILAPNHTGRALAPLAASALLEKRYRTPLGDVDVDEEFGDRLMRLADGLVFEDELAHAEEHAVEVLLPFLQLRSPDVRIVPLVLGWTDWARTRQLAVAIVGAIADRDDVLVIASSDMNHYESAEVTGDKDALALGHVVKLDAAGLLEATREHGISMCGRAPAAVACEVARLRGGTGGELVGYSHSGVVNGDTSRVVGYAAVLLGAA